jgi:hypothetical protein
MAYGFGTTVNPQLGAVDYSNYLRGALTGAQMQAQGTAAIGQGIQNALGSIGQGIKKYQENKVLQAEIMGGVEGNVDFLVKNNPEAIASAPPEVQKILGRMEDGKGVSLKDSAYLKTWSDSATKKTLTDISGGALAETLTNLGLGDLSSLAQSGISVNEIAGLVNAAANTRRAGQPEGSKTVGTIPQGYRLEGEGDNARLVKIPGYEEKKDPRDEVARLQAEKLKREAAQSDEDKKKAQEAYAMKVNSSLAKYQNLRSQIKEVKELASGMTTTGLLGVATAAIAGTPAYDLAQKVETILANVGFDRLQQMREESPTGGALGQVAVQELVALQNSIANLKQGQSKEQFIKNLERVDESFARFEEAMRKDAEMFGKIKQDSENDIFSQADAIVK